MTGFGPTPDELARLGLEVLPRLMRLVGAAAQTSDAEDFLSMTQFRVLKRLAHCPRLGSELAQELRVTPPTVSAAIDSLVRRGLVERGEAADDRRAVPLRLTPLGSHCYEAAQERLLAALVGVVARVQPEERAALAEGLKALARILATHSGSPSHAPTFTVKD